MTRVLFTLSMPNRGSWNGGWSGEGRNFTITRTIRDKAFLAKMPAHWHYSWGDGWGAGISARVLSVGERAKKSDGFCGYDWMVANIIRWNTPYCQHEFQPNPLSGTPHYEGQWERCIHCRMSRKVASSAVEIGT
jgi:hypothetical protein